MISPEWELSTVRSAEEETSILWLCCYYHLFSWRSHSSSILHTVWLMWPLKFWWMKNIWSINVWPWISLIIHSLEGSVLSFFCFKVKKKKKEEFTSSCHSLIWNNWLPLVYFHKNIGYLNQQHGLDVFVTLTLETLEIPSGKYCLPVHNSTTWPGCVWYIWCVVYMNLLKSAEWVQTFGQILEGVHSQGDGGQPDAERQPADHCGYLDSGGRGVVASVVGEDGDSCCHCVAVSHKRPRRGYLCVQLFRLASGSSRVCRSVDVVDSVCRDEHQLSLVWVKTKVFSKNITGYKFRLHYLYLQADLVCSRNTRLPPSLTLYNYTDKLW